jgi:hypothetical protein
VIFWLNIWAINKHNKVLIRAIKFSCEALK